jgi:uncharacterized protein YndB with AHSA1/START domain
VGQSAHLVTAHPGGACLAADGQKNYDPGLITEVEIRFTPADGGTEISLEHRNLERFRKDAETWAARVTRGWTEMLDVFADFVDRDDGGT